MTPTTTIQEALTFVETVCGGRARPGTPIRILPHALSVAAMALEVGEKPEFAVMALLMDAFHFARKSGKKDEVRKRFGPRVFDVLNQCGDPSLPFETNLAKVNATPWQCRFILLCDAVCTARSMLRGYQGQGETYWHSFKESRQSILDSLGRFAGISVPSDGLALLSEYVETVCELFDLVMSRDEFKSANDLLEPSSQEVLSDFILLSDDSYLAILLKRIDMEYLILALMDPAWNEWVRSSFFRNLSSAKLAHIKRELETRIYDEDATQEAQARLRDLLMQMEREGLRRVSSEVICSKDEFIFNDFADQIVPLCLSLHSLASDPAHVRILLRNVDSKVLIRALMGAPQSTLDLFLHEMDQPAIEKLNEELWNVIPLFGIDVRNGVRELFHRCRVIGVGMEPNPAPGH